jgi:Mg/Co/Ni transporter MgtE
MINEKKDNRTSVFNQPEGSKASPTDLEVKGSKLTPELIAQNLDQSNSSQISQFPLEEYSKKDISVVFKNLSDESLEKVITSILPENVKLIFDKFFSSEQESILERLSQQTQQYIINSTGVSG